MKLLKLILVSSFLLFTSNTFAACPSELPEAMLMDCIIAEGAGDFNDADNIVKEWRDSNQAEIEEMDKSADQLSLFDN